MTKFRLVSIVGVRWAEFLAYFRIGFRSRVAIGNSKGDGGTQGSSFVNSGSNGYGIAFLTLSSDFALSGTTSVEFKLDARFV